MDEKPLIGSILSLASINHHLCKKYYYVCCESITDNHAPANNVKNVRCIFAPHLGSDVSQGGSIIYGAIRAAREAGTKHLDVKSSSAEQLQDEFDHNGIGVTDTADSNVPIEDLCGDTQEHAVLHFWFFLFGVHRVTTQF